MVQGASMPKPSWKTPNLTVVARGKPEEKVLLGCKYGNGKGPGATGPNDHCRTNTCNLTDAS